MVPEPRAGFQGVSADAGPGEPKPGKWNKAPVQHWWKVLTAAVKGWNADNVFRNSAAVSFYTLFSLAPVTIIALGVAGVILGKDTAARQFSLQMTELVGETGAKVIQATVTASQSNHRDLVSTGVGIGLLLVGATSVFVQLQDALNEIWRVRAHPRRSGVAVLLLQRVISFGMVLSIGFLLLVSLIVTTILETLVHSADGRLTISPSLLRAIDLAVALAVVTALFAALFKFLPDVHLTWKSAWGGAFLSAALFSVGKLLIATYLAHSAVASIYGTAGSLVALLIWIYYSCAIMFFGVEFMRADLELRGRPVQPKKTAVLIRQEFVP
jgi:membrane protein